MAFRLVDMLCKNCDVKEEYLLDSKDTNQPECVACGEATLEEVIGVGQNKGAHHTWGTWKV